MRNIYITECPRDAMQGLENFVPTELKAEYINLLLQVGYARLDFGSFVSPKAIPQMRDTAALLESIKNTGNTKLLAIIANAKGAKDASGFEAISFLGFPFSVSETFQLRNTNATRLQALDRVKEIQEICTKSNKKGLVYLSMGFGNQYGDPWSPEIVAEWTAKIMDIGIEHFSLADTIGNSTTTLIEDMFPLLNTTFPNVKWGMHLHSTPEEAQEKIKAALAAGCDRLDVAIRGFGGCPMAKDELVGNIATEHLIAVAKTEKVNLNLDMEKFKEAYKFSSKIFSTH